MGKTLAMKRNPANHAEWQAAADCAAMLLAIDAATEFGMTRVAQKFDTDRCREILTEAELLGITPRLAAPANAVLMAQLQIQSKPLAELSRNIAKMRLGIFLKRGKPARPPNASYRIQKKAGGGVVGEVKVFAECITLSDPGAEDANDHWRVDLAELFQSFSDAVGSF